MRLTMEKTLYVRPGEKDGSGNPVGFKAFPGSEDAKNLLKQGFVPSGDEDDEGPGELPPMTAEELQALDIKALKAMAKQLGIPGYGKMHEVQLVAAIQNAQQAQEADDGADNSGGADNTPPATD
jgi:hypothetical protein